MGGLLSAGLERTARLITSAREDWRALVAGLFRRTRDTFVLDSAVSMPPRPPAPEMAWAETAPDSPPDLEEILAGTPARGDAAMPEDRAALDILLADPPGAEDMKAVDILRDCFTPMGEAASRSRILLAVARQLSANFGLPGRRPLTCRQAWRMLDPDIFEEDLADQLAAMGRFIAGWQTEQSSFLCLDFAEIDLIEYLFETLHPARHAALLAETMSFKVLSNRRLGMLRRLPHRVRKRVREGDGPAYAVAARDFLEMLANSPGYPPIIDAAAAALAEITRTLETLKPQQAPPEPPPPPPPPPPSAPPRAAPLPPGMAPPPLSVPSRPAGPHLSAASRPSPVIRTLAVNAPPLTEPVVGLAARPLEPGTHPPVPTPIPRGSICRPHSLTLADKHQAVLKVLRGADPQIVASVIQVPPENLIQWVDGFITAGAKSLVGGAPGAAPLSTDELRDRLSQVLETVRVLEKAVASPPKRTRPNPPVSPFL